MSFVAEDGTGLANANGYVSVAYVDAYHADRGRTDWAGATTANKETAIVRATDYIEYRFGRKFRGFKESSTQALEWPRLSAYDNDGYLFSDDTAIPPQLQKATAEYALIALRQGELLPNPPLPATDEALDGTGATTTESNSGIVTRKIKEVGPIRTQTDYATLTTAGTREAGGRVAQSFLTNDFYLPEYPRADEWISELIDNPYSRRVRRG